MIDAVRQNTPRSFTLSLLTNENPTSSTVLVRTWLPGLNSFTEAGPGLQWPAGVYSLSHVALPFPPEDPLYGGHPGLPSPGIALGNVALRGVRGVLQVSPATMLRMHWNPFYSFLEARMLEFFGLSDGSVVK